MKTLLRIQLTVLALAIAWGVLRAIPWWSRIHLDLGTGMAAAAVALLSKKSWSHFPPSYKSLLRSFFLNVPYRQLAGLAVLSGLAEEALFRGVLLQEVGLAVSSLIFGLLHVGDRRAVLWSLAVGVGLGLLYRATGNLAHCIALHAASNAFSFHLLTVMAQPHPVEVGGHLPGVRSHSQ